MKERFKAMQRPMRIAAIHDLSGFGRCSLAVIIPVLSAMGMQVCAVPTAVLSSHTGGLGEVAMRDLTDYLPDALAHYLRLGLEFECIYSGFLGSQSQIDHCLAFFKSYPDALAVVDPVMGDHGKAYRTVTPDMRSRMHELVRVADVITPNLTETCMLLGDEYRHEPMTRTQAKSMLTRLAAIGPKQIVITGVELASGEKLANVGYDVERSAFWCVPCDYVPASYPGTGDLFAALLTGALLSGDSLPLAINRAARFVSMAIKTTFGYGTDPRHGVMLEKLMPEIARRELPADYQIL